MTTEPAVVSHGARLDAASPSATRTADGDGRHEVGPAVFSADRIYRYRLERIWDPLLPALMVIGLNPSTADENTLDPTLRRVRGFAKRDGYGGFIMTNLFAYRATSPKDMIEHPFPVGPDNDRWLEKTATECVNVLCAWGTHGGLRDRDRAVMAILGRLQERFGNDMSIMCLKRTKHGHPIHPLYVKGDQPMQRYVGR